MALCGVLASPFPAFAEEGKGSLSQLDLTLYPGQLFWIAVCFPLFFVLVRFLVLPSVEQTQGNRQRVLESDVSAAKAAGEETQKVVAAYEKALTEAREKSQAMVEDIVTKAAKEASAKQEALQKDLNARIKATEDKIADAKKAAMREVQDVVQDVAKAIVLKIKASA